MFLTRITVNFGDTDPAGLVYFPNIFHYCHVAMERFFEAVCSVSYSTLIQDRRLGFPTASIQSDFRQPLRYGDIVDIEVEVTRLGNKSLTFSYRILNSAGELCSTVEQVVVAMDLATHQSVAIPDAVRKCLQK